MTALLYCILAWFAASAVLAPVVGRCLAASAEASTHACGGTLLFVRDADGHSYESCSGCEWRYDFDTGRASDAIGMGVRWGL